MRVHPYRMEVHILYSSVHVTKQMSLHDREAYLLYSICPSLVFDISLSLYQGSMDTGVCDNMLILSTKQQDRVT